jgi:hypothetical protein
MFCIYFFEGAKVRHFHVGIRDWGVVFGIWEFVGRIKLGFWRKRVWKLACAGEARRLACGSAFSLLPARCLALLITNEGEWVFSEWRNVLMLLCNPMLKMPRAAVAAALFVTHKSDRNSKKNAYEKVYTNGSCDIGCAFDTGAK